MLEAREAILQKRLETFATNPRHSEWKPENVYMYTIPLSSGPTPFRLFAWHVNSTPNQLKFSLRARLLNASKPDEVTFTELRIERVSTLGANSGICLAKSHLFGPAGSTSSKNVLDEVDLVAAQTVNASTGFMGLLVTANIDAPNACTLQLRCVVHPTSSGPGTNWSTVTCARKLIGDEESTVDVRGWWPRTGARFSRPENDPFDVSPEASGDPWRVIEVCVQNDPFETAARSRFGPDVTEDEHGTPKGNHGLYGANVRYRFKVKNTFATAKRLYVAFRAADAIKFFGAAQLVPGPGLQSEAQPKGVVELIASGYDYSENPPTQFPHNLAEVTPDPLLVTVPPGGSEYYADVAVAVAGAAATPVKILLAREDFDLQEVDDEEED